MHAIALDPIPRTAPPPPAPPPTRPPTREPRVISLPDLLTGIRRRARPPAARLLVPEDARWSYATRCVDRGDIAGRDRRFERVGAGDLLLARVVSIGQHREVYLAEGRPHPCGVDEHVVVVAGNHSACEEFEGVAEVPAGGCDLLCAAGLAGTVRFAAEGTLEPTRLEPVGRLLDADGAAINLDAYAVPPRPVPDDVVVLGVLGTGLSAATDEVSVSLALGLADAGIDVALVRAGGIVSPDRREELERADVVVLDTTETGMASSYREPAGRAAAGLRTLVGTAAEDGARVVVVEFARPLTHRDTTLLLDDPDIAGRIDATVFAASDAAGAYGGVRLLRDRLLRPLAVSGRLARSPHAAVEAETALALPVCSRAELRDGCIARELAGPALERTRAAA